MIYAIHEHELKPGVDVAEYEQMVAAAIGRMKIPGLLAAHHLYGLRGVRTKRYAVLWIFASEAALVENFGTPEDRRMPPDWAAYETEILVQYLDRDPDTVELTDYRQIKDFDFSTNAN